MAKWHSSGKLQKIIRLLPGRKVVLIPGDPEREAEKDRSLNGIPVIKAVVKDLQEIAEIVNIPFDWEKNCIGTA